MELVVARHLLDRRAAAVVLEHDEVADQVEEPTLLEQAFEHDLKLRQVRVCQALARDAAPGLESFPPRRTRADPRLDAVGDDQQMVEGEKRGDLGLSVRTAYRGRSRSCSSRCKV